MSVLPDMDQPSQRLYNALQLASPRKSVAFANGHHASPRVLPAHESQAGALENNRYSLAKKRQAENQIEGHRTWGYGGGMKRSASLAYLDKQKNALWRAASQPCLKSPAAATTASAVTPAANTGAHTTPGKSPTRRPRDIYLSPKRKL